MKARLNILKISMPKNKKTKPKILFFFKKKAIPKFDKITENNIRASKDTIV